MSLDDEDELIGKDTGDVPKIDSGEYCNAKKTDRDDDGESFFAGYCNSKAGAGTDHLGEGRCRWHAGCSTGAPNSNQNSATHSLKADPHHYYRSLSDDEQAYIGEVASAIEERVEEFPREVDWMDRVLARRIAIELHIVAKATGYLESEGILQTVETAHGSRERKAALLAEVRRRDRDIFKMLEKIGVLDDPIPGSPEAVSGWRNFLEDAEDPDFS